MIIVSGIRIPLGEEHSACERAAALIKIPAGRVISAKLRRVSCDARRGRASSVCSVVLSLDDEAAERKKCAEYPFVSFFEKRDFSVTRGNEPLSGRPVVVGFGPAGMFAAHLLGEYGYRPIVLERGRDVDSRTGDVKRFYETGELDERSNVQFGEGGAGAFSDGKLTTRINDPLCDYVLETLVRFGAPEDILYKAKPHVGTDRFAPVVKNMREAIISKGGEVRFESAATGFGVETGVLKSVKTEAGDIETGAAVIACGHSARDMFSSLGAAGASLSPKSFSVGARIEHLQSDVDVSLYGGEAGNPLLPKGEYALSQRLGDAAVYTFCMCPGGSVVAAASERGGIVTNGMSLYARNGKNANAAIAVSVDARDFPDAFAALDYQKGLERAAYDMTGSYMAPAADVKSFMEGKIGLGVGRVEPSYPFGVRAESLDALFGKRITDAMRAGIRAFSGRLKCFGSGDAILTAPETRTSSPVRIDRTESREAAGIERLYPCGEGAGYAGGIMSAAVDGLKTAMAVIERYRPE